MGFIEIIILCFPLLITAVLSFINFKIFIKAYFREEEITLIHIALTFFFNSCVFTILAIAVLLPADIDFSVENQLSNRTVTLQADILKVAHHGSKFSTSQSFLQEVLPQEAVISVGPNPYDHPTIETLTRLANIGANIWRTDYVGTVLLTSNGESYEMLPKLTFLPLSFHTIFSP